MTVSVNHDDTRDLYELGAEIDGTFVAFATIDGPAVRGRIESAKQGAAEPTGPSLVAEAFPAGAFTDNGDGTWTRESDGLRGTFGPAGFTPSTT